ncbi:MAG TPA: hypothetical protein VGH36_05775 [Acetobacteraceae bacterium]|jgi:hypothetical protein
MLPGASSQRRCAQKQPQPGPRRPLAREQAAASRNDASDAVAEAFANWLPRGRLALQAAQDARARAEATAARACLGAARAPAEAVEQMLAQQHAEERRLALRREQAELDEIARRRPLP